MNETTKANSVFSKLNFTEFLIMFLSLLSIINSLVNYETKFDETISLIKEKGIVVKIDDFIYTASLAFNSFSTFLISMESNN